MDHEDEDLKQYLRTFELKAPAPLPSTAPAPRIRAWLAVAAALAIAVTVSLTIKSRRPEETPHTVTQELPQLTSGALTRATGGDVAALDELLSTAAPAVLPDVGRPAGVFHRIAAP